MHLYHPLTHVYLLQQVFNCLETQKDFYNFTLVNSQWNIASSPYLYRAPKPSTSKAVESCKQTIVHAKEKKTFLSYNEMVREWVIKVAIRDAKIDCLIADCCPNIEKFSCSSEIKNATEYPALAVLLIKHWKDLKSISLYHESGNDTTLESITTNCAALEELILVNCKTTDVGFGEVVKACKLIKKIQLVQCTEITDESLIAISKSCKYLTHLDLKDCINITDKGIYALSNPTTTRKLRMLSLEGLNIKDSLLALAEHTKVLQGLSLKRLENLNDEIILTFGRNSSTTLKQLRIYSCRRVKGWGIKEFVSIEELSLLMDCINFEEFEEICVYCSAIEKFTLDVRRIIETNHTLDIVGAISQLKNLKSLAIFCGRNFSDDNRRRLERSCSKLREINL
ncbi:RNI-like protein [Gigaspora margarita]|uniref:RNI-like protein n=1 Tax=Gigaspora margarita TaxID=4874 RepID=A0A8H4A491_GIGMA|nr:RNI-like protein [Gigaspora margarita]